MQSPSNLLRRNVISFSLFVAVLATTIGAGAVPQASDSREFELGLQLSKSRHFRDAIQHFNVAIQTDSKCAKCYFERAFAYLQLKGFDESLSDFQSCQRLDPKFKIDPVLLARVYRGVGDTGKSLKYFDEAIAAEKVKTPNDLGKLYWQRGQTNHEAGKYVDAIADFTSALGVAPDGECYIERARCYRCLKRYDMAVLDYGEYLKFKPHSSNALLHRADCYLVLTKYKEALADYSKAIELKPKEAKVYSFRARAYEKLGREDLAERDRQKAREYGEDFAF